MNIGQQLSAIIAIPADNAEKNIVDCLNSVTASNQHGWPIYLINDASSDNTKSLALPLVDKIIDHQENKGPAASRLSAIKHTSADVIIFLDSDIIIPKHYIDSILKIFSTDSKISAITRILSKESPIDNFWASYKHLYMHYITKRLPEDATYLYGGAFAVRKEFFDKIDLDFYFYGDDLSFGQNIIQAGGKILCDKSHQVQHLKKYNIVTLLKNDFRVPYDFMSVFFKYQGWKQFGQKNTGYGHSSVGQLLSIALVGMLILSIFFQLKILSLLILLLWVTVNVPFFAFLFKSKGLLFMIKSIALTLIDQAVMGFGIFCGFLKKAGQCLGVK